MRHTLPVLASTLLLSACEPMGPLVPDDPGASVHVLPPGTQVPHVSVDPELERQIRVNDQLSDTALEENMGVVPLVKGYAGGAEIRYWDFGEAPRFGALLFQLVRREGETLVPVAHPLIADSLPGERFYSPFWLLQTVEVTDAYQGHVLPSADAIFDAVDLGLVLEPVPAMLWADGPIVPKGTTLDRGEGQPRGQTLEVYANGYVVDMLLIGGDNAFKVLERAGSIPRGDVHQIWIGNAESLSKEPIFQNGIDPWTAAVRVIQCRVTPPDPDDPSTKIDDEAEMFTRSMTGSLSQATDRVVSWTMTTSTKNWPIQIVAASPPGAAP
jgi:hypothetical protein